MSSFHLAGVIPVAGQKLDFQFPWHDCLMPISNNYLAIERSVVECAYAGCETIWIICNDDIQPLIRHRLGDYIYDPVSLNKKQSAKKAIQIFYVPVHPKDREKRDCLSWSVIYGANTAYNICKQISKWVTPDRYYVSFPYGVYECGFLRQHRREISSKNAFFVSHNGNTVKDGEYLGFTFNFEDFKRFRATVRAGTGKRPKSNDNKLSNDLLPLQERWSARFFSLDTVFGSVIIDGAFIIEIERFNNIDNWKGYRDFLANQNSNLIHRPDDEMLAYHEFNPMGINNEKQN